MSSPVPLPEPKISISRVPNSTVPLDIANTPAEAGAYEFLGEEFFVDESVPDPSLVRQIREEADPRYVPLRCKRVYKSPAGTVISRTYHVIGRYIPTPTEEGSEQYIRVSHVPRRFPFPLDRIQALRTLWAPWEKGTVEFTNCSPPAEVDFGPWVVEQMRALRKFFDASLRIDTDKNGEMSTTQVDTTRDKLNEILNSESKRDEALMAEAREEARYRVRHNWRQLKQAADEGRWTEPPAATRPFVDLGRKGA
jgi:hypothetical protein